MQRAFVSAAARAGLALLVVLVLPNALVLASSDYVITPSGQRISGIFEGLRPSAFMLKYARRRSSARREKWFLDERKLDAHLGAQLALACVNSGCQPDTLCADHYQKFDDSSGCIESPRGPVRCHLRTPLQTPQPHPIAKVLTIAFADCTAVRMRRNALIRRQTCSGAWCILPPKSGTRS